MVIFCGDREGALRNPTFPENQQRSESVNLGQRLLSRALANLGFSFEQVTDAQRLQLVSEAELNEFDDILEGIGLGIVSHIRSQDASPSMQTQSQRNSHKRVKRGH